MINIHSIFLRIVINVLLPLLIIFSAIAYLSYSHVSSLQIAHQKSELKQIQKEIAVLMDAQNQTFVLLKDLSGLEAEKISKSIVESVTGNSKSLVTMNLDSLIRVYDMDPKLVDLYIIDIETGIIVNTTFETDLGICFYDFGQEHKDRIISLSKSKKFHVESYAFESATRRSKSYTYLSTNDGRYIVELGMYSKRADEFMAKVSNRIDTLTKNPRISELDIFLNMDRPFSLYREKRFDQEDSLNNEKLCIQWAFENMKDTLIEYDNKAGFYSFYTNNIIGNIVLRLIYDHTSAKESLNEAIFRNIFVFGAGILVLIIILTVSLRKTTRPIQRLTQASHEVSAGDLSQRVVVTGSDEVSKLSSQFNEMVSNLDKSTNQLIHQKHIVEEKNQEIMDSIAYARRIQEAILPPDSLIKEWLINSFVLYKPKDIVAGDFYWMEVIDNLVIFAAADCTGHGVPGALVSVVCNDAMNRAVREFNLLEPNRILDKTRELVIETFSKSGEEVKDGMDISLCALDIKTNILSYAGANNGLYLIRDSVLTDIKADKQPIGMYSDQRPFTKHEIQLEKGDSIYLSTDGFADQFGGPKPGGKKFKYKPYKEMLVRIQDKSMSEQKEIINQTFESWRGDLEQIDDVCIIGVRI